MMTEMTIRLLEMGFTPAAANYLSSIPNSSYSSTNNTTLSKADEIDQAYESYSTYPSRITDGWHRVTLVNKEEDGVKVGSVKVRDNRIFDGGKNGNKVDSPSIERGKVRAHVTTPNGDEWFLYVYFFNDMDIQW